MKKTDFIWAAIAMTAAMVSCQVEPLETVNGEVSGSENLITKTMYVEPEEWLPEDGTKTSYISGTGITWTGNETFDIFYGANGGAEGATSANKYMRYAGTATKGEGNTYTFSHEAIDGAASYDYSAVTPAIPRHGGRTNGDGKSMLFEFSPIQTPGQNTYDPNYDVLFGKGVKGVNAATSLTVCEFKRVSTPFKLELSDGDAVIGSAEKIRAVTAAFGQEPANNSALAGLLYMKLGADSYDDCEITSRNPHGNALTAIYAEGLALQDGIWPVWYMAVPTTIASGTNLTLTVVTDNKTITKTITAPGDLNITADKFNTLKLNVSGTNSSSVTSVYQDFTALSSLSSSLTASDGNTYGWGFSECSLSINAPLPQGLSVPSGASVTLPYIPGKKITKIRLYANPDNAASSATIKLNSNDAVDFNSWADGGLVSTGGVLEIAVPESEQAAALSLASTGAIVLSGISLELTENPDYYNDYYAMYQAGEDIVINGVTYNKGTNGDATLVNVANFTMNGLNKGGIIFVDDTDVTAVSILRGNTLTASSAVVIGRYKTSQPKIIFKNNSDAAQQLNIQGNAVFKNMNISSEHSASMFAYTVPTAALSLTLEDCTLTLDGTGRYLINEVGTASSLDIYIDDCIIEFGPKCGETTKDGVTTYSAGNVINYHSNKTDFSAKNISVTNSVIYSSAETPYSAAVLSLGTSSAKNATSDVAINVCNNTIYNIVAPNVLVRTYTAKSMTVKDNVAYNTSSTVKSYLTAIYNTETKTAEVAGNYLFTTFVSGTSFWSVRHTGGYELGTNYLHAQASNCILTSQVDLTTGYIPVNTTVVTNGAGASYDTKPWITTTAAE